MISQPNYSILILLAMTNLGMRKRLLHFARASGIYIRRRVLAYSISKKRISEPKSRF
jgi:hypothetical protein